MSISKDQFFNKMTIHQTQATCCVLQLILLIAGLHYGIKYSRQHGFFGLAREYAAHPSHAINAVLEKEHQFVASARKLE